MVEAYWHKFFKSYDKVDLFIAPSQFLAEGGIKAYSTGENHGSKKWNRFE
nr:hypothetical protein [Thermodesulfobacteriota bacterium]